MEIKMKKDVQAICRKDFLAIMKEIKHDSEIKIDSSWQKVKIALLGSGSLQYFSKLLEYCLLKNGINVHMFIGTYQGMELDIMDENSDYNNFGPDITIIFTDYRSIIYNSDINQKEDELWDKVWKEIEQYEVLWNKIKVQNGSYIMQTNIVIPLERKLGNLEGNYIWSRQTFLELLNYGMRLKKPDFVSILDFNYLASLTGKERWFDYSNYYLNKCNMSYECLPSAVEEVALNILNYCGVYKKCIILDLDNTLWGGILEEDGIQGVNIFPNDALGEAFRDFQSYLKGLKDRGVILAVCSKNDKEYAQEVFKSNKNMILHLEDISCFVANWDNKVDNIKKIVTELNIGYDSVVFLDDNPAERNLVRLILPEITVPDLPKDPANYVTEIEKQRYFEWLQITKEDMNRTASYKVSQIMEKQKLNYADYSSYLDSLEMKAHVEKMKKEDVARTAQLFNKTNQFNTIRFRTTEAYLLQAQSEGALVLTCHMEDKYNNYGLISCAIIKVEEQDCIIQAWAMSCRVFKRTLEEYMLNHFIQIGLQAQCSILRVLFIPNERNRMVAKTLESKGFVKDQRLNDYILEINPDLYLENNIQ